MSGCSRAVTECHSDQSDVEQPREVRRNGKEPRPWTAEAKWTSYIQQCSDVQTRSPSAVSIFRVPNLYQKDPTKKAAYVPTRVSLGPYHHHGSQELCSMENHKARALCRMMTRFNDNERNLSTDPNKIDFSVLARNEIVQLEDSIRNKYGEEIEARETLAEMLTLDGSFILEILRAESLEKLSQTDYYEPIFECHKIRYTGQDILQDILKLENQIPFIVLRKLLYLEINSAGDAQVKLILAVRSFLEVFYPFDFEKFKKDEDEGYLNFCILFIIENEEFHHLLQLLHTLVLSHPVRNPVSEEGQGNAPSPVASSKIRKCWDQMRKCWGQHEDNYTTLDGEREGSNVCSVALPRAVELRNAGIEFEQLDNGGIKEIYFDENSATIYLPLINITHHTEVLFRNLIAFEMCRTVSRTASESNYVAWYVNLMGNLIDSEEDVALLRKNCIVTNGLGSDAKVAELFNDLVQEITVDNNIKVDVTQKVYAHYKNKFNVYFADLVKEYFSTPWKIVALAGAIVLLLLTTAQTIVAILALYK